MKSLIILVLKVILVIIAFPFVIIPAICLVLIMALEQIEFKNEQKLYEEVHNNEGY